jgi:hypothetical protein
VKPACSSAATALASGWPATPGTGSSSTPLDRVRATAASGRSRSPVPGSVSMTVPSGASLKASVTPPSRSPTDASAASAVARSMPPSSGTSRRSGPLDSTIVTVESRTARSLGPGRWSMTRPAATSSENRCSGSTSTSKPACSSWAVAAARSRPSTGGMSV